MLLKDDKPAPKVIEHMKEEFIPLSRHPWYIRYPAYLLIGATSGTIVWINNNIQRTGHPFGGLF